MLPEVLRGNASHPFLEQLRELCDDGIDVSFSVPGQRNLYGLYYYLIGAVGLPQGVEEKDGGIESQGEYRGATGGLCRPPEKVHVGGGKPQNALVRDESDCPAGIRSRTDICCRAIGNGKCPRATEPEPVAGPSSATVGGA